MLKQTDIDAISDLERTPLATLLLDAPTLILGCVRSVLEGPPLNRVYDGRRVLGADGYGFTRAQGRPYAEAVRDCLASKGISVSYGSSFPTSAWLNKNTPETFAVWLFKNATKAQA